MEKINQMKASLEQYLNEKNKVTDALALAEQKTGVKRLYLVLGLMAFTALWLVVGYGAELLCNLIGFIYPAYASVKAIESSRKEDDTQWLIYWVVFGVFSCVEFFSDILLSWFPFYCLFKCVFLVWCYLPISCNGSNVVYYQVIRRFVLKHQEKIDTAISSVADNVSDLADKAAHKAMEMAVDSELKKEN